MASTYSANLKIELIGTGDQVGDWGDTTNDNLGTVLEEAIVGYGAVQFTNDANLTLSLSDSNASQTARNYYLYVTSTVPLSATRDLIVPTIEKPYVVHNATSGSQSIRVKTAAGTGITVPTGKKMILYVNGTNVVEQVNYVTDLGIGTLVIDTPLPVLSGGTGASTASVARSNLGLGTIATQNANNVTITGGSVTGITDLAIADGGTGASTASNARTNLGLGTIATQDANNVAITGGAMASVAVTGGSVTNSTITGGSISGITDLAVADGGTGASTAAGARTNLGLGTISTQDASNVIITGGSISGITDLAVADGGTGSSTAAGARTNLGLGTISTQDANNVTITGGSISGITDLAVADGGTGASTAADARTNLGLGTMATQNSSSVAITGGAISGITDLAVADGGTGASDAATARTNLGAAPLASPTFTGIPAAPTAASGTNTTQLATTAFVQTALQAVYPVGSIYINASSSTNPATLLGFGTWSAFGAGRVLVGIDGTDPSFDVAGETGGTKDAAVVSHTHTATVTDPGHGHSLRGSGWSNANCDGLPQSDSLAGRVQGASGYYQNGTSGNRFVQTSTTGITVANSTTGSSGTNGNLQPYIVVYMWRRTA